jgi:hypothetical protein
MYEFLCRNNLKLQSQLILYTLNINKYLDNLKNEENKFLKKSKKIASMLFILPHSSYY